MKKLLAILLLLPGCSGMPHEPEDYSAAENRFIKANYLAAESLSKSRVATLDKSAPIVVATLVNIDNLEQSSTLGRTVSEQVASRLANMGFTVKEVKLRGTLFVKSSAGELLLSRELRDITASHKAQAVVVGTYARAGDSVYLNLKLVDVNNTILSGYDYAIPANSMVKGLLGVR